MTTKLEELASAIRGTMPPEPALMPPLVDPPLRLYADTMAAAMLGPAPAQITPPGVPGTLTATYPAPWAVTPGPHVVAASHGTLPELADAALGQMHVDGAGEVWVCTGVAWRKLLFAP